MAANVEVMVDLREQEERIRAAIGRALAARTIVGDVSVNVKQSSGMWDLRLVLPDGTARTIRVAASSLNVLTLERMLEYWLKGGA